MIHISNGVLVLAPGVVPGGVPFEGAISGLVPVGGGVFAAIVPGVDVEVVVADDAGGCAPGCGVVPGFVAVPEAPDVPPAEDVLVFVLCNMLSMAERLFVFEVFREPEEPLVGTTGCVCSYEAWAAAHNAALVLSSGADVQISVVPNTVMTAA